MGFKNLSLFSVLLAAVSLSAARQNITWNQFVPGTDLYTSGYAVLEDNWSIMVSRGNEAANILPSRTFALFEESPKSIFFTQVGDYPFCLMTERPLPRERLEIAFNANPNGWNSTVKAHVPVEGRGVRLTLSEYKAVSAKDKRIDFLCKGFIVNTVNVTELAFPDVEPIHIEYYLPYESFNVTIYELPETEKNILETKWNQFVPNTDLYTEGSALLGNNWLVMNSKGNEQANILPCRSFVLFEESPDSIFFTRIKGYPFCLMTARPLPRSRMEYIFQTFPTEWNSTVEAIVPVEGRGVRLTESEYAAVSAKDNRIDFLCEGNIVNTVNVTELAFPDVEPIHIEYYLPYESFNVTIYNPPTSSLDNLSIVG